MKLGAVAEYSQKRISVTDLTSETYVGVDNLLQDRKGKTVATFLPEQGSVTTYNQGDILIGNIRPYLKKIWFSNQVGGTSGDVLTIQNSITPCMGNKYLYYIIFCQMIDSFIIMCNIQKVLRCPEEISKLLCNISLYCHPLLSKKESSPFSIISTP